MIGAEDLIWETYVPARPKPRRWFTGWRRAYKNAVWWAKCGTDAYISNNGYKELLHDGKSFNYERETLPNYNSADVRVIFLDLDFGIYQKGKLVRTNENSIRQGAIDIDNLLGKDNIKRRWHFTGGGFHCLISAEGPASKMDDAVMYMMNTTGAPIDAGSMTLDSTRRLLGSTNTKHGTFVIPVSIDEISAFSWAQLKELATEKRKEVIKSGEETWYFGDVSVTCPRKRVDLGKYSRKLVPSEKEDVLMEYGLDWDLDFCDTMKYLLTKEYPGNHDRIFIIKYIKDVLKVPFVDILDDTKTVNNLIYNLMDNKNKAKHCIKYREPECVYKRDSRFHPYKLKKMGICPEDCTRCLERRQGNDEV